MAGSSLGVLTTQSTTVPGGDSDHALTPGHPCAQTLPEQNPWWGVKLDKETEIHSVTIENCKCRLITVNI